MRKLVHFIVGAILIASGCSKTNPTPSRTTTSAPVAPATPATRVLGPIKVTDETCAAARAYSEQHGGHALLVMVGGVERCAAYASGWTAERPHPIGPGTMSIWGPMAAVAAENGWMHLDHPASELIEAWQGDPRRGAITVRQLLTMTSGLEPQLPDDPTAGLRDGERVYDAASLYEPGTHWQMSATSAVAFGEALGVATADSETRVAAPLFWIHRYLLQPIGFTVDVWEKDAQGWPLFYTGIHLTASQWAMFGEFIRTGGKGSDGSSVVDTNILGQCFEGTDANPDYGMTWHLKLPGRAPKLPADVRLAGGDGQYLLVIPSEGLTIVRFGDTDEGGFELGEMVSRLLYGSGI